MNAIDARLVRDTLDIPAIADLTAAARDALAPVLAGAGLKPGARVAVTAGSRGIARIDAILRGACAAVRPAGATPFLIPAMGSHGGGTAEGQQTMLAHLGVTEASVGAPLVAAMDVVDVGRTPRGVDVVCDANAARADAIVVVGRVKPHTDFTGTIESGLIKMTAIGLGKAIGAARYHAAFAQHGYETILREVAAMMFARMPIVAGLAIVEDNHGGTHALEAFPTAGIVAGEERLLLRARDLLPRLPFDALDLLIVDRMGKNFSGTGMDTNVTGRGVDGRTQKTARPVIRELFVRDLSPESEGNATGIGLADFCTRRLADAVDWVPTYLNALTAAQPAGARLPVVCAHDREAIGHALTAAGVSDARSARVARIRDTLHIDAFAASPAAIESMDRDGRYVAGEATTALHFDGDDLTQFGAALAHA
ncbi:hypothetical protein WPS_20260 [Vulcanimicrobium alpinum]|uniref:LarA-like N-terminal domain-containing protein n=1 Tax=Vulcanimicrobium alpinum TaxID=3016050 RepID=A0AAN2C9P8_UNVUL|nr:lactate racemase domain-containing protein [Vulcanimicrobium alpinum]BDE06750.1 hypothetical protein WPS_20260 [Vulcanimicrobium alpinum]